MNTLQEDLRPFDLPERKKFSFHDVSRELSELPEGIRQTPEVEAEFLAMAFQEGSGGKYWGTYYGPCGSWVRKDTGEEVVRPDRKGIKPEHIRYWEKRSNETRNPLMRMRYKGLLFDFKQYVTGEKPGYREIIMPYLETILDVVDGEYCVHGIELIELLGRALQVSSLINHSQLFEKAQDLLWRIDHKYGKDEHPGFWARHFKLMLKYRSRYGKYEAALVKENEGRFERSEKRILSEDKHTGDIHILSDVNDLLCEYYHIAGNDEKVREYLNRELTALRKVIALNGGLWGQGMLQMMQEKFRKHHLYKEANRLFVDIQNLGQSVLDGMKEFRCSIPVDKLGIETILNNFLAGAPSEVFNRYLFDHIPNINVERKLQKEEVEADPFMDVIRTTTFDANGSPINNLGVGKDSGHQKLMHGMHQRMLYYAIFLREIVKKMVENNKLSSEIILEAFKDSPIILESQRPLIDRGLKAYFEQDYAVACHLLIPQFESAIRRLVALNGGAVLQPDKDPQAGNRYISLDGLLESQEAKTALGENIQVYFKNLFTERCGWNLRNMVSHGLLQADAFNAVLADRVVHAFAVLSLLKKKQPCGC